MKVPQTGEKDPEEDLVISVRVGTTTVVDNVSLAEGLTSVIQLCFVFHLLYPSDSDDIFNYAQRIVVRFGPSDGAKNLKGAVKKRFLNFRCDLPEKSGTVKKLQV